MEETEFITESSEETKKLGEKLSKDFKLGDVISLSGDLGSGKTTFVQGLARGYHIENRIISPTFILIRKHAGKILNKSMTLYHIDLYRIEDPAQIKDVGLAELFQDKEGIFVIEWAKRHPDLNPDRELKFEVLDGNNRAITVIKNE